MKKILFGAVAAALICSCSGEKNSAADSQSIESLLTERLEKATTWQDSVIAIEGTFLGGYYNYLLHSGPGIDQETLSMRDVERGIRQVMAADSADMSYIYGLNIGLQIREGYLNRIAELPLDKGKFMDAVIGALNLDSIDEAQIRQMSQQFEETDAEVKRRHQQEIDREIFNSPEAEQNRVMAQSIFSAIQSNPDFHQIENTGIYAAIDEPGEGELLAPNDRVRVNFTVLRLSGEPIENGKEKAMFPARGYNPMLTAVLPYMRHGEKAKFLVPYELCYGIQGNPNLNIGPCESLYITVEVL